MFEKFAPDIFEKMYPDLAFQAKCQKISYFFPDNSGSNTYFSKPIFALKPWVQAICFEYHEPYNRKNFFRTYLGVLKFSCAMGAVG